MSTIYSEIAKTNTKADRDICSPMLMLMKGLASKIMGSCISLVLLIWLQEADTPG